MDIQKWINEVIHRNITVEGRERPHYFKLCSYHTHQTLKQYTIAESKKTYMEDTADSKAVKLTRKPRRNLSKRMLQTELPINTYKISKLPWISRKMQIQSKKQQKENKCMPVNNFWTIEQRKTIQGTHTFYVDGMYTQIISSSSQLIKGPIHF